MRRITIGLGLVFVLGIAWISNVQAHDPKERKVRLTGCVATGEHNTFLLTRALPMMTLKEQQMSGNMGDLLGDPLTNPSEMKTYELVGGKGVKFGDHVGHRVDVTGLVLAGSHSGGSHAPHGGEKSESGGGAQQGSTSETTTQGAKVQLKVISIQHMAPACS